MYNFRSVRFTAGTLTYESRNTAHFYPSIIEGALGQDVWFDEGSTLDTGSRRLFTTGGIWHLGGTLTGGTFNPQRCVKLVCERDGALAGRGIDPYTDVVLDLNGYNQDGVKWPDVTYGGHLVVTSAVPARITMTVAPASSPIKVAYRGMASLRVDMSGKTATITNDFSDTIAPLEVVAGTLCFTGGAGWGGTNVTIRANATLQVEATSAGCAFKPARASIGRANLVVEDGGSINLVGTEDVVCRSLVYDGNPVAPGRYTSASGVGVTGSGTLVVAKLPGKPGAMLIVY